ncbi:DUF2637 domain-containing protein [Kineosporia succinea]|uniref:DUF2637 domain-containing protein n=1 Tax=Kineosporia succinea TaxID=84632 RepID=A0ABT9PB50_9ACTN|nr:DUF2637 domain-containing protein [Kineosporia succinea]MDP9829928.1 hypothetical protein [Kineosporia succinea]
MSTPSSPDPGQRHPLAAGPATGATVGAAAGAAFPEASQAAAKEAADLARQARRLSMWARVVLVPVAIIGAVLSYQSLYKAALPTFGPYLAAGFPLLVDLLILGASLQYVAGAKIGRPMTGWRLTAHCGVAGTLILNALAARELGEVPWHITAPAVWAVLVELTGKQVLGQWKAAHHGPVTHIAPSLWLSAPIESVRTRLLMARTGLRDAHQARIGVGTAAAAREALNLALPRRTNPRRDAKRVRRVVNRQMRAGSLPPAAVLDAVGWTSPDGERSERSPEIILRSVVQEILRPTEPEAPALRTSSADATTVVFGDPSAPTAVFAHTPAQGLPLLNGVNGVNGANGAGSANGAGGSSNGVNGANGGANGQAGDGARRTPASAHPAPGRQLTTPDGTPIVPGHRVVVLPDTEPLSSQLRYTVDPVTGAQVAYAHTGQALANARTPAAFPNGTAPHPAGVQQPAAFAQDNRQDVRNGMTDASAVPAGYAGPGSAPVHATGEAAAAANGSGRSGGPSVAQAPGAGPVQSADSVDSADSAARFASSAAALTAPSYQPGAPAAGPVTGPPTGSLWAAAQARTNGPSDPPTGSLPLVPSTPAAPAAPVPTSPMPEASRGRPVTGASTLDRNGSWAPTAPLQQSTPGADAVAPIDLIDSDDDWADEQDQPTTPTRTSSGQATQTGSIPISGRATAKQKEERLNIAVRILNGNPDITGPELRSALETQGWVVSDRTAARLLGEARQIPPLTVRY